MNKEYALYAFLPWRYTYVKVGVWKTRAAANRHGAGFTETPHAVLRDLPAHFPETMDAATLQWRMNGGQGIAPNMRLVY
jgi:hypothetical protein